MLRFSSRRVSRPRAQWCRPRAIQAKREREEQYVSKCVYRSALRQPRPCAARPVEYAPPSRLQSCSEPPGGLRDCFVWLRGVLPMRVARLPLEPSFTCGCNFALFPAYSDVAPLVSLALPLPFFLTLTHDRHCICP